jgi:acyl-CoA hydrolase
MGRAQHSHLPTPSEGVVAAVAREATPYTVGLLRRARVGDGVRVQVAASHAQWKALDADTGAALTPKPWEASWRSVTFLLGSSMSACPESNQIKPGAMNEQIAMPFVGSDSTRGVRYGRLFELLDAFTGEVAMCHTRHDNPERPLILVTAGADSMEALYELDATVDFSVIGAVTRVGTSSLEITAEVWQHDRLALTSRFHYVARDAVTQEAAAVNPLMLDQAADAAAVHRSEDATRRAKGRRDRAAASLYHSPPTATESKIIHDLHSEYVLQNAMEGKVRMPEANRSVTIMHMDNRNIHGKIFGGYLLRKAYEAAWSTAVDLLEMGGGSSDPPAGTAQIMAAVQLSRVSEVRAAHHIHSIF